MRMLNTLPQISSLVSNLLHIHHASHMTLTLSIKHCFPITFIPSVLAALFASHPPPSVTHSVFSESLSAPSLSPQIIYIRFVLCRLGSHADEGLQSLWRSLGPRGLICRNLFTFFLTACCLKPLVKCVWITSTALVCERN